MGLRSWLEEHETAALLGGTGALLLAWKLISGSGPDAPGNAPAVMSWDSARILAVRWVAGAESGKAAYAAQNRNTDGAGLSYGLIQWTQKSGNLGKLLAAMQRQDPAAFKEVFGGGDARVAASLLAVTTAPSADERLRPVPVEVPGVPVALWAQPWTQTFADAGKVPAFRAVQEHEAAYGEHMTIAIRAVDILGVASPRALVLAYDRAVQQGASSLKHAVWSAKAAQERGITAPTGRLYLFARRCAEGFRSTTEPESGRWLQVDTPQGTEYHKLAGNVDLYTAITRRTTRILEASDLSDGPLPSRMAST
jgi:hypothetical protein